MDVEIAKKEKEILRLREIRSVFVRTNIREWMIADAKQKEEVGTENRVHQFGKYCLFRR